MVSVRKLQHVSLARATQRDFLHVDLPDGGGEVHHAALVVTVLQPERMADLVDDLFADPL